MHIAGRAADAEIANQGYVELASAAGVPEALAVFGGLLYYIRLHQGRLDEIADLFIEAGCDNPSIASLRSAVTLMLSELGRTDEVRERLSAEAANGFHFPTTEHGSPRLPTWPTMQRRPSALSHAPSVNASHLSPLR